jgi:hypothetical protein
MSPAAYAVARRSAALRSTDGSAPRTAVITAHCCYCFCGIVVVPFGPMPVVSMMRRQRWPRRSGAPQSWLSAYSLHSEQRLTKAKWSNQDYGVISSQQLALKKARPERPRSAQQGH